MKTKRCAAMLYLILVDTELETIPGQLQNEPDVLSYSQRRGKQSSSLLLDASFVHRSIKKFYPEEVNRRGRPDLVHTFLMVTQESILNKKGLLRTFVHTRNNLVMRINPDTRLPKSYSRFVGLLETVFETKAIRSGNETLLTLESSSLSQLLGTIDCKNVRVLSPRSSVVGLSEIIPDDRDIIALIGGFSSGDFLSDVYSLAESFSIFREELTTWTVASELITEYERRVGLQN